MKPADFILILISLTVIIYFTVRVYSEKEGKPYVQIQGDGESWIYPLSNERELKVPGTLGNTLIRIDNGVVSVVDSPCKDKLCVQMGELTNQGHWSACLPNRVFITIKGEASDEIDSLSY